MRGEVYAPLQCSQSYFSFLGLDTLHESCNQTAPLKKVGKRLAKPDSCHRVRKGKTTSALHLAGLDRGPQGPLGGPCFWTCYMRHVSVQPAHCSPQGLPMHVLHFHLDTQQMRTYSSSNSSRHPRRTTTARQGLDIAMKLVSSHAQPMGGA